MPSTRNTKFPVLGHVVAVSAALSLGVLIILLAGTGRVSMREVAAIFLISTASVASGRVLGVLLALEQRPGITSAFDIVAGASVLALLTLSWSAVFDFGAIVAFFLALVVMIAAVLAVGLGPAISPPRSLIPDLVLVLGLAVVVAIWTRSTADAPELARATGYYPAWPDYFAHAAELRYLRDKEELQDLSPTLADAPQVIYHRASYVLSAIFSALGGRGTLEVASCHWAPLGLLLMAVGAYGYGSVIAGWRGGAAGAYALLLAPDGLSHGFGNRLFSFHWLIAVGPAAAYAIALGFVACALLLLGHKQSRPALLIASGASAAGIIFFKVQVALPLLIAFAVILLVRWTPRRQWDRLALVGVLGATGVAVVLQFETMQRAPHFLSGQFDTTGYLGYIHRTPSVYREWYIRAVQDAGIIQQNLVGVALVLLAAIGFFLPLAATTSFIRMKRRQAGLADLLPLGLIGGYLVTMFCMPTPFNGDPGEFKHRPFVLIYAVLVSGSVSAMITTFAPARTNSFGRRLSPLFAAGGIVLGLLYVFRASRSAQHYDSYRGREVNRDVFAAADFIREHAGSRDVVLSSDEDPEGLLTALTERPAYLARVPVFRKASGASKSLVARRTERVAGLLQVKNLEQLRAFGRAEGIQWYLLYGSDNPEWGDAIRAGAAHVSGSVLVFDLR